MPKIRKRIIIAIFITFFAIIATKNIWLIFKPLPVEIQLSGDSPKINISALINCRNNDKFHRVKKDDKIVSISKETIIKFNIKDIIFPKRLRIDFSELKNKNPIIVKEISFKNGNIKIKDFKNFSLYGGELKTKDNELIIIPKEDNCRLYYNKALKFCTIFDIEIELLIIIIILAYLLSYKLTDYIANFSSIKHKSKIEVIFLSIFFIFLFLPMSHINHALISKKENRILKKYSPAINPDGSFNYNFTKNFSDYFLDRFFLKDELIALYYAQFTLNKNLRTRKVTKGKDGWLFYGIPSIKMYTNENLFEEENLKNVAKLLTQYDEYCKKRNKKFYFYIAPSKPMIYKEFYSDLIKPKKGNEISLANQLIGYLRKNTDVKVIYPYDEIVQNKDKGLLYFKTDTHWNEYGAYIGYRVLMREINKDIKLESFSAKSFDEVTETSGDLNMSLPKRLRIKKFETYKKPHVPNSEYYCQKTQDITDIQNCKGYKNDKNLLMFRDSFTNNLIPYLAPTFKKSKFIWQTKVDFKQMEDADIVILEIVELSLPALTGIKMEL